MFPILLSDPAAILLWTACATSAALLIGTVMLHSPHDVIADVRVGFGPGRRKTVFAISRHNLLRSEEDGPWTRLTSGLGAWKLSSLAISPAFAHDRTLFVASFGGGVFRSMDAGLSWTPCNQGLGDRQIAVLGLAPDFASSRTLYAIARSGEVYRSTDAGGAWSRVREGRPLETGARDPGAEILLDPTRDAGEAWKACHWTPGPNCIGLVRGGVVMSGSSGELIASRDGGASWSVVARLPDGVRATCIEIPEGSGLGDPFFVGTDTQGVLRVHGAQGRVEPTGSPSTLACVTALGSFIEQDGGLILLAASWDGALFVSRDAGTTWVLNDGGLSRHRQADEARYGSPHFSALAVVPESRPAEVYVGGFDGLFRTSALGRPWDAVETLPLGIVLGVAAMAHGREGPLLAIATYGAGVYRRSPEEGAWRISNGGLETLRLGTITYSPNGELFTVGEGCVLRLEHDGRWAPAPLRPTRSAHGASVRLFAQLRKVERLAARYFSGRVMSGLKSAFHAGALRLGGRVSRFVFPTVLAFSPDYATDQTLFVGTRAHGVFRSRDGGRSFDQVWDGQGRFVSALIVAIGPTSSPILFACLSDGLHRSDDGGVTWSPVDLGPAFLGARVVVSPAFASDGVLFVGGRKGLLRSTDGGASWETLRLGVASHEAVIGGLALSPDFPADEALLVHVQGEGLYRSLDRGNSFERLAWIDAHDAACAPPICFPDSATLFQFSPGFAEDRTLVAAAFDKVYVSRDWGSWTCLDRPTRYEDFRPEIRYEGDWRTAESDVFSARRAHHSRTSGDEARLSFVGAAVRWIGSRGPDHGAADVLIDGEVRASVDLHAPEFEAGIVLYAEEVPQGVHEIVLRVRSTGAEVWLDALDVGSVGSFRP